MVGQHLDDRGQRQSSVVGEGEIFLLPAMVPHSPHRPADSWGLVVEIKRRPEQTESLLWLCDRDYFACDHEFVTGVGRLIRRSDFYTELKDFQFHPDNRGLLRGGLRLRISANRMSRIFFEVWSSEPVPATEAPDNSVAPFGSSTRAASDSAPSESA